MWCYKLEYSLSTTDLTNRLADIFYQVWFYNLGPSLKDDLIENGAFKIVWKIQIAVTF